MFDEFAEAAAVVMAGLLIFTVIVMAAHLITDAMRRDANGLTSQEREAYPRLLWKCSWCQQESGEAPGPNETHGMCERHFREQMKELGFGPVQPFDGSERSTS